MTGPDVLVVAYGGESNPSTRLRILQYLPHLESDGFRFETLFVPQQGRRTLPVAELRAKLVKADVVFVQRVLTSSLLRELERAGRPVVYDIDDALQYVRQSQYRAAMEPRGVPDRLRIAFRGLVRGNRLYSSRKRLLDEMLRIADDDDRRQQLAVRRAWAEQ